MLNIAMFDTRLRPVITGGDIAYCAPAWDWEHVRRRWHPGFNLWLIRRGRGRLVSGDEEFELKAGECFLQRMWEYQHGTHNAPQPLVVPFILFDFRDAHGKSLTPDRIDLPPRRYVVPDAELMTSIIDRSLRAFRDGREDDAVLWLNAALSELREANRSPRPTRTEEERASRIDAICAEIVQEPGRTYRLDDLADRAHYSRDHFVRLFKKRRGVTPNEFVIRTRVQRAQTLLSFSNHSVGQIASLLGYADAFCFSHQFKERTGVSPTEFRRRGT